MLRRIDRSCVFGRIPYSRTTSTFWRQTRAAGRVAFFNWHHVVETLRSADGHHQGAPLELRARECHVLTAAALQQLSRNQCVPRPLALSRPAKQLPGVSLRQMVQFGEKPSTGTLFRASQFLSEELPIRLAHRVQELHELPDGLNEMPSICRVRDWYAQSFEVRPTLFRPNPLDSSSTTGAHQPAPAEHHLRSEEPPSQAG